MREAAVGNALSPTVDSLVGGISADVDDDLSLCLELMSATRRSSSQRYSGRQVMQTTVDDNRLFEFDTLLYSQQMFPLFFKCERNIFMPERQNFLHRCHPRAKTATKSVSCDTRLMSLDLHPVSASQTKYRVQRLDARQMYITHMTLKITARRCSATCATAQPRSLQRTLLATSAVREEVA